MKIRNWFTSICLATLIAVFASSSVFANPTDLGKGSTPTATKSKSGHESAHKNKSKSKKLKTSKKIQTSSHLHHDGKKGSTAPKTTLKP